MMRNATLIAMSINEGIQNIAGLPSPNKSSKTFLFAAIKAPGLVCCGVPVEPNPTWITNPNEVSRTSVFNRMPAATRFKVSRMSAVFINTERILFFGKPYDRNETLYFLLYKSESGIEMLLTASGRTVAVAAATKTASEIKVDVLPEVFTRAPETGA